MSFGNRQQRISPLFQEIMDHHAARAEIDLLTQEGWRKLKAWKKRMIELRLAAEAAIRQVPNNKVTG